MTTLDFTIRILLHWHLCHIRKVRIACTVDKSLCLKSFQTVLIFNDH